MVDGVQGICKLAWYGKLALKRQLLARASATTLVATIATIAGVNCL